jgi:hypothetical protein
MANLRELEKVTIWWKALYPAFVQPTAGVATSLIKAYFETRTGPGLGLEENPDSRKTRTRLEKNPDSCLTKPGLDF